MSEKVESTRFKRIVRVLGKTFLVFLLFFQLTLLWVASNPSPIKIPTEISNFLLDSIEQKGIKLQARNFWIQPDLSLAMDDLSVEVVGITGEIFTAERLEFQISASQLVSLKISPQRLNIRGGKIICPSTISEFGERRTLLEDFRIDLNRKGAWLNAPIGRTRLGNFIISLEGELPLNLLSIQKNIWQREDSSTETLAQSTRRGLSALEKIIILAKEAGGGSIQIDANADPAGGAELKLQAVLANHPNLPTGQNLQARIFELWGNIQINKSGEIDRWSLQSEADDLSYKNYRIRHLIVAMNGAEQNRLISGHIIGVDGSLPQLSGIQFHGRFVPKIVQGNIGFKASFESQSRESEAVGELDWAGVSTDPWGEFSWKINYAQIAAAELNAFAVVKDSLHSSGVKLTGYVGLAQAQIEHGQNFKWAEGNLSFTGLDARGLNQKTLSSIQDTPLITYFSFHPARAPYPLQIKRLQLGTLQGEIDCALAMGGAFSVRLHGDIHPSCLDQILGDWWIDTWKLFEIKRDPRATIDAVGKWGELAAKVKGRVRMDDFTLLNAPFRAVTLSVDTDEAFTRIGIEELAGGTTTDDGSVTGHIVWDWRKPKDLTGPMISLRGNLQPWIAAKCGAANFSEILHNLELPPSHTFALSVSPTESGLTIEANAECLESFKAWGVESKNFKINVLSKNNIITANSSFILADGEVKFSLKGKSPHESEMFLELKNCDTLKITRLAEKIKPPVQSNNAVDVFKPGSNLNFSFHGTVDIEKPTEVRGLGSFDVYSPDLKKVRLLGGLSAILESLGIGATTYTLDHITGHFGCLNQTAYFPDIMISGSESRLGLNGQIHLDNNEVDFNGEFVVPKTESFTPLELLNLTRNLVNNSKITVKGPISTPTTDANPPWLSLFFKSIMNKDLGKIPDELAE